MSDLRKLIGTTGNDPRVVLASAPPGYRLNVDEKACDVGRFVIHKTAGLKATSGGLFREASRHLSAALAEWRGSVLEDLGDFQFADAYATALTEDKLLAHTARAEAEIACGRGYSVIAELESLTGKHRYHEPLWAQLITAYYVSERQSEALDTYSRLKAVLADELGIDPGRTLRELQSRILRQEALDVAGTAKHNANTIIKTLSQRGTAGASSPAAFLRDSSGRCHPLRAVATTIGRLPDNHIVIDHASVSRHHAVIVDTGTSFMIADLRSANGVAVQHQKIRDSARLDDGDLITISGHKFTFEVGPLSEASDNDS